MADLLIKPLTGAGNTVTIQDQAGGAILTSADSGATLADGVQDNITRLGTVTTGDITTPLANATFPTGHILQVITWAGSSSHQQASDNSKTQPGVSYKQLTAKGASSVFLAYFSCETGTQGTGSWTGGHEYRTSTDGGSNWSGWTDPGNSSYSYNSGVSDFRRGKFWHTLMSPSLALGKLIQIRSYCGSYHSNAAGFDGPKYETFWEIKA